MSARHRRRDARKRGDAHLEIDHGWLTCWNAGHAWFLGHTDKESSFYVNRERVA